MFALRKLGQNFYAHWLETRCFLLGLRLAWVSAASAGIGLALFLGAPPAQDILLEVRNANGLWAGLGFWALFYLFAALFWALPVFVSARWILTRAETDSDLRANIEPIPVWVRSLVPACLAVLCFLAILAGQIVALGTAPTIDQNARAAISGAQRYVNDENKLRAGAGACRRGIGQEECRTLVTNFAILAGEGTLGGRRNAPKMALAIGAFLAFWFYLGRPSARSRLLPVRLARRIATALAAYLVVAFTIYQVSVQFVEKWWGPAPLVTLLALLLVIPAIVWLAWRGHERWLWWVGSFFCAIAAALVVFALYGIVEAERNVPFSPVHLFLLPFATVALAALAWWCLARASETKPTRIGAMLLWLTGQRGQLSDAMATARLVNPIFYVLLGTTVVLNLAFVVADPLDITGTWQLNRVLLLCVVLGFPVAALTYLTYLSLRWRAPLILAVIALVGALGVARGWLWGDYFEVRPGAPLTIARPTLHDSVVQWARANDCELREANVAPQKPCPAPIIVTAAGGASRAAFHLAGVVGELIDGQKLAPLGGHRGSVYSAVFSADGDYILTASLDTTARIWNSKTGALLAVLSGHKRHVYNAAFSPDGKRVATASWDGTAKIWDISNIREPKELTKVEHRNDINSAVFNADGKLLLTASDDKTARIWDAASGLALADFVGHGKLVHGAAFSPDGRRVVTASWDHTARIWDVPTPEELKALAESKQVKRISANVRRMVHADGVNSATFSPDGKLVVTASNDKTARIWDVETGHELARMTRPGAIVFNATFSPDGKRVATAAWDHTAQVWNVPTADQIKDLKDQKRTVDIEDATILAAHSNDVNSATFSPDGKVILTASDDKTARIWDARTGVRKEWDADQFRPFAKQLFAISGVSGGSLGAAVVYASLADSQRRQDLSGAPPCSKESARDQDWFGSRRTTSQSGQVQQLEPSEDPQRSWKACLQLLVAGDFLSPVFVGLTRDPLHPIWMSRGDRAQLLELAWERRYGLFTRDPAAKGAAKGSTLAQPLSALRREITGLSATSWLPLLFLNATLVDDGKRLISSDADTSLRDERGRVVHRVFRDAHDFHDLYLPPQPRGHSAAIQSVAASPDGTRIISASDDGTARIWDAHTGAELAVLKHEKRVNGAAFSPDGARVVTASWDRTAAVWDVTDLANVKSIAQFKHSYDVNSAAFSPDGKLVVTTSDDGVARVWDIASAKMSALSGHKNFAYGAAFNPAGNLVVTASWDRTAKLWDVSDLERVKEIRQLVGHTREVMSAAFSSDGRLIATASADKTARIWDAETGVTRAVIPGHDGLVSSAAFSPDGKLLLTGSWDHSAQLWDVSNLNAVKPIKLLRAHDDHINSVAFTSRNFIISGSRDRTVRIWNPEGSETLTLDSFTDGRWAGCRDCDIRLSTAASMSARFPIISPSGSIPGYDQKAIRVVDGGYHENFGAITAMELAHFLEKTYGLQSAVIFVNNDPSASGMECLTGGQADLKALNSWLWDPVVAMLGTQTARGSHAAVSLCDALGAERFAFVTIDPTKPYVTLSVSWWISKTVQHYLDQQLAYNRRAFATISRMRQAPPPEHRLKLSTQGLTQSEGVVSASVRQ